MESWNLDSRQQSALKYFSEHASEWRARAAANSEVKVNTIRQRKDHAIRLVRERAPIESALDLGCGSGELVVELAEMGVRAFGIDYSDRMIELGRETATLRGVSQRCRFEVASVLQVPIADECFDLVTAFGLIEYLNPEQLPEFFSLCRRLVGPGKYLQVGSRNRLFNVFSLNQFTAAEHGAGTLLSLSAEALQLATAGTIDDFLASPGGGKEQLDVLKAYPQTDVAVAGYQYTPRQIATLLVEAGFRCIEISPVHYHGVVPAVGKTEPGIHAHIAQLVHQRFQSDLRLVPMASTFIVTAN